MKRALVDARTREEPWEVTVCDCYTISRFRGVIRYESRQPSGCGASVKLHLWQLFLESGKQRKFLCRPCLFPKFRILITAGVTRWGLREGGQSVLANENKAVILESSGRRHPAARTILRDGSEKMVETVA